MSGEAAVVRVSRVIPAPRESVFDAWLDPEIRREWWERGSGSIRTTCEIDARVGGRYGMQTEADKYGVCTDLGVFKEIRRPERLVFTWTAWHAEEGQSAKYDVQDSEVTVEFHDQDGQTEVVITHRRLPTDESREGHRKGWDGMLRAIGEVMGQ